VERLSITIPLHLRPKTQEWLFLPKASDMLCSAYSGLWVKIAYIARGEADANQEYASLYDSLDSCLVADDEEMDFDVHRAEAPFLPGDRLLLCSDGVHDTLGDPRLMKLADPGLTLRQQVDVWRKAVLLAGAPDNFSMLLAQR
jgi:serine/threonine protein phosphatase PrpC